MNIIGYRLSNIPFQMFDFLIYLLGAPLTQALINYGHIRKQNI